MTTLPSKRLEPVGYDHRKVETLSREVRETERPVYAPGAVDWRQMRAFREDAPEQLQVVAALLWQGWLILAGLLVGGTALVVLARVAYVVLRWALA
jgi:hypothetical protein